MEPSIEQLETSAKHFPVWGGKFRLLCGVCYQEMRCDMKSGEYLKPDAHNNAARKFWQNGWRTEQTPICPLCKRRRGEKEAEVNRLAPPKEGLI